MLKVALQLHLKVSIGIQNQSGEARTVCRMPFLTQHSPFPGLGLAPPMAPIKVEAGEKVLKSVHLYRLIEFYKIMLVS
jgi:hypothetical protein